MLESGDDRFTIASQNRVIGKAVYGKRKDMLE